MPLAIVGASFLIGVIICITALLIGSLRDERRRELKRAKEAINTVYTLAWQHRDIYPELSGMVLDTIQRYEVKELA